MGVAAAGLSLIGSGVSAYGAIKQGRDQAEQDRTNAMLATYQAQDALARGAREAGQLRMRGSQVAAQQHLAYANSGIDASSGTPLDVMADTRMMSELDAQTAKANAARAAWGYKLQATQDTINARRAEDNGAMAAFGTMLGGMGSAASLYGGGR